MCTVGLLRGSSANFKDVRELHVKFSLEERMGQQVTLLENRKLNTGEDLLCELEGSNSNHLSHQFYLGGFVVYIQTGYSPLVSMVQNLGIGTESKHRRFELVSFCSNTVPSIDGHERLQHL